MVWLPTMESFRGKASLHELEHGEGPVYCDDWGADNEELVLVFVPPLVTILRDVEQRTGVALTESKVNEIRDDATCIALRRSIASKMEKLRGFSDIDPENCWEEWNAIKRDFTEP